MFERPESGERVVLVQVDYYPYEDEAEEGAEFLALAESAGAEVIDQLIVHREKPDPRYYIGRGKVSEILHLVETHCIDLVIFNQNLAPGQERNLESHLKCRVLDRTGLILDIFAGRARSFEGKLQVELAQLNHLSTRLVRGWTHLERQKGGIGLRGPGETQLELDRRIIRDRIKSINKRLDKVQKQRRLSRRARERALLPTVALVGYTNAGKSTLFNVLASESVYVEDKLFATLDTTLRKVHLPQGGDAIFADTVGFIKHLPDNLVEAFKGTLEETAAAQLLLHIVDASDEKRAEKMKAVDTVLEMIGADVVNQVIVFNKIDLVEGLKAQILNVPDAKPKIWLSAEKDVGTDKLLELIAKLIYGDPIERWVVLGPDQSRLRANLYELGSVKQEEIDDEGFYRLFIRIAKSDFERLFSDYPQANVAD